MPFDGSEGGEITLQEAVAMTTRYRDANLNPVKCGFMGKDIINQLLDQPGAMGLRIYFALNEAQQMTVVLVGATNEGQDMLDLIADRAEPCPSNCPSDSPLC
ncbi:hypothetical protein [Hymenobacter sp. CRA2]|uniref:hypothetical protein n=1 Tax=Hymenobacter sp. CRA2 TaxID=1955620 RepID=UPI00098F6987|nr:hypothetical protein [Hymenobacter sp. CRA2]OON68756.1 hypothetical protein B0919_11245 [Hymenobacter sp. CRA2]